MNNMGGFGRGSGGRGVEWGGCTCSRCIAGFGRGAGIINEPRMPCNVAVKYNEPGPKMWRCGHCRAECFMHREKCYKCASRRPVFKNIKPNKELCPCGCKCVAKHGCCGTDISFFDIPLDVFIPLILKRLTLNDVCSLACVDKSNCSYFSSNPIWKPFYIEKKLIDFIPKKKMDLAKSRVRRNDTMSWTRDEIQQNRCTLVILNATNNIPMDVYWVPQVSLQVVTPSCIKKMNKKGSIPPGAEFVTQSYPNHKWFCLPTEEWLRKNPASNVGFSFVVNVLELSEYSFKKSKKLAFVRKFHEPKKLNPVKGTDKELVSIKKAYMALVLNHEKLKKVFMKNKALKDKYVKETARLQKQLKFYQKQTKRLQEKEKSVMWAQSVVKQK
jgi:hypothetical protein